MGEENLRMLTVDATRANGFWVTNEDETGLVLKIKGEDNNDYTAMTEDGKRVERKFKDLQTIGAERRAKIKESLKGGGRSGVR
jgi:hypothetical protein